MQHSRRSFIRKTTVLAAGTALASRSLFARPVTGHITGIQLYSVRDDMRKAPLPTLKALADMGYKYVEHANYVSRKFYGFSAVDFKKVLDDHGLKMLSGHTVMGKDHWDASKKDFSDSWKYTVEDAAVVGQEIVISPSFDAAMRKNYDDFRGYMDVFNKCGELCKRSGMKFGYHNHDFEFTESLNGQKLYDIILTSTDPKLVTQQLDIGNLYSTGADAMAIIRKNPGRFDSLHVKDEIKTVRDGREGYESTILGTGVANTKAITDEAKKLGAKHFIVEQEAYQGKAPIDAAKEDLEIMKGWGY